MPDISMCKNEQCTLKEKCFRYMAEPNEYRQAYTKFNQEIDLTCKYFTHNKNWPNYTLRQIK